MDHHNGKPFKLKSENKGDYLHVNASGTRTLSVILAIMKEIMDACRAEGTPKTLVDVRELEGRLNTLEAFELPAKHFASFRDRSVLRQAAIVDLSEFEKNYRFFENVAVNRGYQLRVFSDTEEAASWLLSD